MTSWRMSQRDRWLVGVGGEGPSVPDAGRVVNTGPAGHLPFEVPERMHEALVCVRLTSATPGSHLLDFLRSEPCAVGAWWIAADVDAIVRMASTSRTVLHRAVADLRRRGGAEVVAVHVILRAFDLSASAAVPESGLTGDAPAWPQVGAVADA